MKTTDKNRIEAIRAIMQKYLSDFRIEADLGIAIHDAINEALETEVTHE